MGSSQRVAWEVRYQVPSSSLWGSQLKGSCCFAWPQSVSIFFVCLSSLRGSTLAEGELFWSVPQIQSIHFQTDIYSGLVFENATQFAFARLLKSSFRTDQWMLLKHIYRVSRAANHHSTTDMENYESRSLINMLLLSWTSIPESVQLKVTLSDRTESRMEL